MKLDTTQKVTTQSGIDQENALLNETAQIESSLTLQILDLESEAKQVSLFKSWFVVTFLSIATLPLDIFLNLKIC